MEHIDFQELVCEHINKHHGRLECIGKIEDNLNLLGLVNTNETQLEMPSEDSYSESSYSRRVGSQRGDSDTERSMASIKVLKKTVAKSKDKSKNTISTANSKAKI